MSLEIFRYETPKEIVANFDGPMIFLAGPTVRGNQLHLTSWRFKAIEIFQAHHFDGALVLPEFNNRFQSDKGRRDLPIWEHNGLKHSTCIMFWVPRTKECWGLNTNSEHGYWLAKKPFKLVYGRPDDAFRIEYNDVMWDEIFEEHGGFKKPIFNTIESTVEESIRLANQLYYNKNLII